MIGDSTWDNELVRPRRQGWTAALRALWILITSGLIGSAFQQPLLAAFCSVLAARRLGWTLGNLGVKVAAMTFLVGCPGLMLRESPLEWWDILSGGMAGCLIAYVAWLGAREGLAIERAAEAADTDDLTGVLNRSGFLKRLETASQGLAGCSQPIAVAFLDCDRFKEFNDTHGHLAGDRYLTIAADLMAQGVGRKGRVGRLGGDEFGVLLSGLNVSDVQTLLSDLLCQLNAVGDRYGVQITWTIGVAIASRQCPAEELLDRADRLMLDGKREQPGSVRIRELELGDSTVGGVRITSAAAVNESPRAANGSTEPARERSDAETVETKS